MSLEKDTCASRFSGLGTTSTDDKVEENMGSKNTSWSPNGTMDYRHPAPDYHNLSDKANTAQCFTHSPLRRNCSPTSVAGARVRTQPAPAWRSSFTTSSDRHGHRWFLVFFFVDIGAIQHAAFIQSYLQVLIMGSSTWVKSIKCDRSIGILNL